MLTSWQSFVGVLSASFCSAILFAKIAKTQSIAHVAFSENVVIRFGHELLQDSLRNSSKHNPLLRDSTRGDLAIDLFKKKQITKYPAPILEFRIVNLLHGETGGEVMNCKLNVVASSLEEVTKQDCITSRSSFMDTALPSKQAVKGMKILQSLKEKAKKAKKAAKVSTSGKISRSGSLIQKVNRKLTDFAALSGRGFRTSDSDDSEGEPFKEEDDDESESGFEFGDGGFGNVDFGDLLCEEYSVELAEPSVAEEKAPDKSKKSGKKSDKKSGKKKKKHDPFVDRSKTIFVDEEPSEGDGGPRRVFSKVVMETDSHPFFKRVWNVRHILNEKSPLLNADARSLIRLNDGFWPASMCNADVIKSCLEVTQLIVTMSGTAVASGSSVYKLHVYDLNLAKVGYIFENPLAKDRDGKLTVDWNLVNAMVPQKEAKDEELSDCSINLDSGDRGQSRFGRMRRRLSFGMTTLGPTA